MNKNNDESPSHSLLKVNFRWIKDLNRKKKAIKVLEENMDNLKNNHLVGKGFLSIPPNQNPEELTATHKNLKLL